MSPNNTNSPSAVDFSPPGIGDPDVVPAIPSWNDLSKDIHDVNVSKGFWPDDVMTRNVGEALALIHSEITEAWDAAMADAADDKLTQYPGVAVEVADAIIRTLDLGGAYGVDFDSYEVYVDNKIAPYSSITDDMMVLNKLTSMALEYHRKKSIDGDGESMFKSQLAIMLFNMVSVMDKYGFDEEVIVDKLNFNRSRPYKHGKKY